GLLDRDNPPGLVEQVGGPALPPHEVEVAEHGPILARRGGDDAPGSRPRHERVRRGGDRGIRQPIAESSPANLVGSAWHRYALPCDRLTVHYRGMSGKRT